MLDPWSGRGTLLINSRPWSQVFVDGRPIGNTPITRHTLSAGRHVVELRTSDGRVQRRTITVRASEITRLVIDFGGE